MQILFYLHYGSTTYDSSAQGSCSPFSDFVLRNILISSHIYWKYWLVGNALHELALPELGK